MRVFAGIYEPLMGRPSANRGLVAGALPADALGGTATEEGLTLAWTRTARDSPVAEATRATCALDGRLHNIASIASDLGIGSGEAPEHVLSVAYEHWGEGMLERLRGTFTFIVWDRESRRGLLAVDQLGAGSLFLDADGARLLFASEVRNLLRLLPQRPPPDRRAVVQWLADGFLERNQTLYEGISRLEGGHFLELSAECWRKHRYWSPGYKQPLGDGRSELVDALRGRIRSAVRSRVAQDGSTAVLLSGGVDSSSVAVVADQLDEIEGDRLRTYSALFPAHPSIDESVAIDAVTAKIGAPSTRTVIQGGGILAGSLEFLRMWELPTLSPTLGFLAPMERLAAADGAAVLLDGEGGDELFGCAPYLLSDRVRAGRIFSAASLARSLLVQWHPGPESRPSRERVSKVLRGFGLKGAAPHALHAGTRRIRGSARYSPVWFTAESAQLLFDARDPWAWKAGRGPRWWAHLSDLLTEARVRIGAHDLLRRKAALSGLDGGHPFLDDLDLIEFVLRLPPEVAYDSGLTRPLLRESMTGLLPEVVRLRRSKSSFNAFIHECLTGRERSPVVKLLTARDTELRAYVRPDVLRERIVDAVPSGWGGPWESGMWRLLTMECWLRLQADQSFPDRALETWGLEGTRYDISRVGQEQVAGARR
jgi:asparagine synthase (glutamine-hydrolysing)